MSFRKIVTVLLTALCLAGFVRTVQAAQVNDIQVSLDRKTLSFDVPPQIINGRLLVPFRLIGERMGASVGWDANSRRVDMVLGDKYLQLTIDRAEMVHGLCSFDTFGQVIRNTQQTAMLDAAPRIVNGRTLVPVRAISECLGCVVRWDPNNRTVYITSPAELARPVEAPPSPTPQPAAPDKDDSFYLQNIADNQAQIWANNNSTFILFYYSSKAEAKERGLVIQAARSQNLLVYAIDRDGGNIGPNVIQPYLQKGGVHQTPALFLMNGAEIRCLRQLRSQTAIENAMFTYWYKAYRNGLRPDTIPQGHPQLSPAGVFGQQLDITTYWRGISREEAIHKQNIHEKFIYVCYDSFEANAEERINFLKLAAAKAKAVCYVTDCHGLTENKDWFGAAALGGQPLQEYPAVFFVYGGLRLPAASIRPDNMEELLNAFINFQR